MINSHSLKAFEDNKPKLMSQDVRTLQLIAQSKAKGINALEHSAIVGCHKSVSGKSLSRCLKNENVVYMERRNGATHGRYYFMPKEVVR